MTVKYGPDGTELWSAHFSPGGFTAADPLAIAVDAAGNSVIAGGVSTPGFGYDYLVVKYDPLGRELWSTRYDGPGALDEEGEGDDDIARDLVLDRDGGVYVTGDSDGGPSGQDFATVKLAPDGTVLWATRFDGPASGGDVARSIALDGRDGSLYVAGDSTAPMTFQDIVTVKYDRDGRQVWSRRFTGNGLFHHDAAVAVRLDGTGGVYVSGYAFRRGSGGDYVTLKYDRDGNGVALAAYGGPSGERNGFDEPKAMVVDAGGSVYVTGRSTGLSGGLEYATVKYVPAPVVDFRRGDSNADGGVDLADAMFTLGWLFTGGPRPDCLKSADTDDTGDVQITDPIFLLGHLFLGGAPPQPPVGGCGRETSLDFLSCERFAACR